MFVTYSIFTACTIADIDIPAPMFPVRKTPFESTHGFWFLKLFSFNIICFYGLHPLYKDVYLLFNILKCSQKIFS